MGSLKREETPNGPLLRVGIPGTGKKALVLCHFDTVHPVGAFAVPWKIEGERAYGPGVYDMKGNIVQLLWALRTNQALGLGLPALELLFTPDEEVGSTASRPAIEAAALRNDLVLVLEAPMGNGDLKVARKGVGQYRLTAHGKPAHQGVEPEKGVNAIVELAHQVLRVEALQDWDKGTTLGPNVIKGAPPATWWRPPPGWRSTCGSGRWPRRSGWKRPSGPCSRCCPGPPSRSRAA